MATGAQLSISCGKQLWEGVGMGLRQEEWAGPPGGRRVGLHNGGRETKRQTSATGP